MDDFQKSLNSSKTSQIISQHATQSLGVTSKHEAGISETPSGCGTTDEQAPCAESGICNETGSSQLFRVEMGTSAQDALQSKDVMDQEAKIPETPPGGGPADSRTSSKCAETDDAEDATDIGTSAQDALQSKHVMDQEAKIPETPPGGGTADSRTSSKCVQMEVADDLTDMGTSSQRSSQTQHAMTIPDVETPDTPSTSETTDLQVQTSVHSGQSSESLEIAEGGHDANLMISSGQEGTIVPIGGTIAQETTQATAILTGRDKDEFLNGIQCADNMEEIKKETNELHLHFNKTTAFVNNPGAISLGGTVVLKHVEENILDPQEIVPTKRQKSKLQVLRDKTSQEIEEWTEGMVETRAVKTITDKVQEGHPVAVVTGCPGEGKTTTAYLALKRLQDMGREVYEVRTPEEYYTVTGSKNRSTILLSDIWGSSHFSKDRFSTWEGVLEDALGTQIHKFLSQNDQHRSKSSHLQQPNIILVTRKTVLMSALQYFGKYKSILLNSEVNLSDKEALSTNEKMKIWYHHAKLHNVEVDEREVNEACKMSVSHGFPYNCHLFASDFTKYSKIGMVSFFLKPIVVLNQSLVSLLEEPIAGPLLRAMLKNEGVLSLDTIEDEERVYQYQTVVDTLKQTYLKQTGYEVSFHHQSVYDSVAFLVCSKTPQFAIQNCTMTFLNQMVSFNEMDNKAQTTSMSVVVENHHIPCFLDRLKKEFHQRNFSGLFGHRSFYDERFTSKFMESVVAEKKRWWTIQDPLRNLLQTKDKRTGESFIFHATESGSNKVLKWILTQVDLTEKEQRDALLGIIENTSWESLECLISAFPNLNVDEPIKDSLTPVLLAAMKPTTKVFKMLVQRGADITKPDIKGNNVLQLMCANSLDDCREVVNLLVGKGIQVNVSGANCVPSLHSACLQGNHYAVTALLQNGADVNMPVNTIRPVHVATLMQHNYILSQLLAHGAEVEATMLTYRHPNVDDNDSEKPLADFGTPCQIACFHGNDAAIKILCDNGANVTGRGLLHIAVLGGHNDSVTCLLEKGACVNEVVYTTPLHVASAGGHDNVIENLLRNGATMDTKDEGGYTALLSASSSHNTRAVKILLKNGANVNDRVALTGETPLHFASKKPCVLHLFEKTISSISDVRKKLHAQETEDFHFPVFFTDENIPKSADPLSNALGVDVHSFIKAFRHFPAEKVELPDSQSEKELLLELQKRGADVNKQDADGNTPFHVACEEGNVNAVMVLLSGAAEKRVHSSCENFEATEEIQLHGRVDLSIRNKDGKTALGLACFQGNEHTVSLLLDHGATTDQQSLPEDTPLHLACNKGHDAVVRKLLDHKAEVNSVTDDGYTPLHLACFNGHVTVADTLLKCGADLSIRNVEGNTALYLACDQGHESTVTLLLDQGAEADQRNLSGEIPLHAASSGGHEIVVRKLLDHKAEVNSVANDGNTPLHLACLNGHLTLVQMLLKSGAAFMIKNKEGNTALHYACERGHESTVTLLLIHGAKLNQRGPSGKTPLHVASYNGHETIVRDLLDHKAEVNSKTDGGFTPLYLACSRGHVSVAHMLLKSGADLHVESKARNTALHIACAGGHESIVTLLLDHGAKTNKRGNYGQTSLHVASYNGRDSVVRKLLDCKASVNKTLMSWILSLSGHIPLYDACQINCVADDGNTSLHLACLNGHVTVARMLLESGAALNIKNKRGNTALHYARERGHERTVALLLDHRTKINQRDPSGQTPLHVE